MNIRTILLALTMLLSVSHASAAVDHKTDSAYIVLRDAMTRGFNSGDSALFYPALINLQNYLLSKNDLHAYYTQRCNEIVFQMNRQRIYEAYVLGRQLSQELREKKLDKEMYMAYNMLGHINRYCGNKEAAKRNFYKVIGMMEEAGYYESIPPIYMNLVNVSINDDHEEAMQLLDKAKDIAIKYSPERVFDIETRKTLSYFNGDDIPKFLEGYEAYKKGVAEGKSSVHGRTIEVYYLAAMGKTGEAIEMAKKELGDDSSDAIPLIYERAGRWQEAYQALKQEMNSKDSINNVVLANSMQGIREQLSAYDTESKIARNRTIALIIGIIMLVLLATALLYIVVSRRKHLREMKKAYNHALESDKMKTAFIQNVSHEVRTPLNIIGGFSQIIADPELTQNTEERQHIAKMMQTSTHRITSLIDEMLELSLSESSDSVNKDDNVEINDMLRDLLQENQSLVNQDTVLQFETTLSDNFSLTTNQMMLKRAISALIDNAIKNTDRGSITLKASAFGIQLSLAVEDTGRGIPFEEAEHIFERFVKLDTFKEGLGLGLTLCRTLTEKLGGTVSLDKTFKGPGARFVITLPLSSEDQEI
jgi:signal transduction histidine kinase